MTKHEEVLFVLVGKKKSPRYTIKFKKKMNNAYRVLTSGLNHEKRPDSHVCLCEHYETPKEQTRNPRKGLCTEEQWGAITPAER